MPTINVEKLTDVRLLRTANRFTTNRESHMGLATAYRYGHSPIRTQLFWIELTDIPLFVASQLVRSHVGVQFYQLSQRPDRGGKDLGRYTPTNLAFLINAEALMNMAHKRLCRKASEETREIVEGICEEVAHRDRDLAPHLVPQCIYRGVCPEPRPCGFLISGEGTVERMMYARLFRHPV